jgi:phenylalanyl-tRNA synthetase beta chain
MKISHSWLKEYIRFSLSPPQLAARLSMLGLEVERYENSGAKYEKFVVGHVLERSKHPHADRLSVCRVDVGAEVLQIVCGAPNVAAGQKVAVGLPGATVPRDQHDPQGRPFVLQRTAIRGVESQGMICSEYELDLGDDRDGILILDEKAKVGRKLADHLGLNDVQYEVEITANRGDWLSHIGVAREMQVLTGRRAALPKIRLKESRITTASQAKVHILDPKRCRRYAARVVRGIRVGPSPIWLQNRLSAIGIRSINNVVDITNYVMMETGQPVHAFDYDQLAGRTIRVRCADEGETFVTLDGKQRILRSDILMICDAEKHVAIAGVMGGANSEISAETTNVLIESANFEPSNIRRTSKYLGMSTDASQRFERGVDIEMAPYAADRVAQLLMEIAGGEVLKGVIDFYPRKLKQAIITLRPSRANELLGTRISDQQMVRFLRRLNLRLTKRSKNLLEFEVPTYRLDLEEEIDLIEELARVYGYNNIETETRTTIEFSKPIVTRTVHDEIRTYLSGAGFQEILGFSLIPPPKVDFPSIRAVEVLNPVTSEAAVLRTSLLHSALPVAKHNWAHGERDLRLYEIGTVFSRRNGSNGDKDEELESYAEEERLLILLSGRTAKPQFNAGSREVDLFDLKGEIEALLSKFNLDKYRFISYDSATALIESALAVEINGTYAGLLGKLAKSVAERFDIEDEVFVSELNLELIEQAHQREKKYRALPRFPSVKRDLAFVVDSSISHERIESAIRAAGEGFISELLLFDLYVGEQVGPGKKSLAYALKFQPYEKTMTDAEADALVKKIVRAVEEGCGARLRSE